MSLLFKDIYNKAINLFDDPVIRRSYVEDTVKWEKKMYKYLENGINKFTNPTKVSYLLVDQTEPIGQISLITGDGSDEYELGEEFSPMSGSDFSYVVGGKYDKGAVYEDGKVKFSHPIPEGVSCTVEWYYAGCFNTDFAGAATMTTPANVVQYRVKDILANALLLAWAENEKNFLLDIRNLLTDTDFKLYSPANSVRAKVDWVEGIRKDFDTQTNKLCWDLYSRSFTGGRFYG